MASISLTVQRLKPESEPYRFRSWRATSTAFAPGKPVRNRIAINSGSTRAEAPCARSFSRGRSLCGISLIFNVGAALAPRSVAFIRSWSGHKRPLPHSGSGTELIEQFPEGVTELEKRIDGLTGGERFQLALRLAHKIFSRID